MIKLILVFILLVNCHTFEEIKTINGTGKYITRDLFTDFYSDPKLKQKKTKFYPGDKVYMLMVLYNREIRHVNNTCIENSNCRRVFFNYTGNLNPEACPIKNKKVQLFISEISIIERRYSYKFLLYKLDRKNPWDVHINFHKILNSTHCRTRLIFVFNVEKVFTDVNDPYSLPILNIKYHYTISNETLDIRNFRNSSIIYKNTKRTEDFHICCSINVCDRTHNLSCFKIYENLAALIVTVILVLMVFFTISYLKKLSTKNKTARAIQIHDNY